MRDMTKKLAIATAIGLTFGLAAPAQAGFLGFFAGHGIPGMGSPLGVGAGGSIQFNYVGSGGPSGSFAETSGGGGGTGFGLISGNTAVAYGSGGGGGSSKAEGSGSNTAISTMAAGGFGLGMTTFTFGALGF